MFLIEGLLPALLLALAVDRLMGDPPWLYRRIPHPVQIIGAFIADQERRAFASAAPPEARVRQGRTLTLILVGLTAVIGLLIQWLCLLLPFGWVPLGLIMSTLIAQQSLADHVGAVAKGLDQGLEEGRAAVRHIVGRDPEKLDDHGVARSAVESLAENFSDGVAAPVLFGFLLGLPGMLSYKAINTADSMIGHTSDRHRDFGRFAALLDDAVNWWPARGSALLIAAAAKLMPNASATRAWAMVRRDARHHRSPNGGWPEAAMAGALDIRLSGPRSYHGETTDDPWIGDGNPKLASGDIRRALQLFWWSWGVMVILILAATLII